VTDRRPPPPPRGIRIGGAGDHDDKTTVLAQRPEISDKTARSDGGFDDEPDTSVGHERMPAIVNSDDVSLISALETGPAPSSPGFDGPPPRAAFGDGLDDDGPEPATEVLRLAFSDPDAASIESVTPTEPPIEVRKWRAGGNDGADRRPRAGVVALPAKSPESLPAPPPTRVDATPAPAPAGALDVDELRFVIEDAERLLKTVKSQAQGLDLEARGMNAQLAAALHRLGEALAMLKRS
jgi:hypothetical protein